MRNATYVLDGLLYHESELRIDEHYTDTHGFTDHIFALCHALGFRFAPRIRDLKQKRLYVPDDVKHYPALKHFLGDKPIDTKVILAQWPECLRLATSIKQGTVTASLMLRKLASYPRQNGLARALREPGRIERTLFLIDWLIDPPLRQRVTAGLNKGEARNALARAVCFNRLGKLHDRTYELQRHRASGLNLVVAAIMLWNTITRKKKTMDISRSLENAGISSLRSVHQISRKSGQIDRLSVHLSPQVSHGRKPDKAGCPTMLERVKPSRVKGSLRRASPALDPFSGVTDHDRI